MNQNDDDLLSLLSNSISVSDDTNICKPPVKKARKRPTVKTTYPIRVARVPKRTFELIHRRVKRNKPVIDVKTETLEKTNCNRFILNQIQGEKIETISPESTTRLIWEMKERLQRRQYGDLAKLISVFTEMPVGKMRWYPTLIKYCLILLMYDPLVQGTDLMNMFLDGVMGCRTNEDKKEFLKDINRLPTNIHVTKYDHLWTNYPIPNQLTEQSLDQLCEQLNKRIDIKPDHESDDESDVDLDSEWETYDENSSDDDNETTTEPERVCDLKKLMNQLKNKISK